MVTAREVAGMEWWGVKVPVKDREESKHLISELVAGQPLFPIQFDRYDDPGDPHLTFRCPKVYLNDLKAFLKQMLKVKQLGDEYEWKEHPGTIVNAYVGSQVGLQLLSYLGGTPDGFQMADFFHFLLDALGYVRRSELALYRIAAARMQDDPNIYLYPTPPPPKAAPRKR